jgi:ectoine hydroxylase-related dioxygenase (phytanoyl-CoA dioxygenase family)
MLSDDYTKSGFVILRDLFDSSLELADLQDAISSTVALRSERAVTSIDREIMDGELIELHRTDPRHVSFVYDVLRYSPALSRLLMSKRILKIIGEIFGASPDNIVANNLNLRVDMPGQDWSENLPWHQDWPYNNPLYLQGNSLASWVAIFDVPVLTGPMELKVGSHVVGEVPPEKIPHKGGHKRQDNYVYQVPAEISDSVEFEKVQPSLRAGDVILFDLALVHRSGINLSSLVRWSAQARYHNARNPSFLKQYACSV